MRSNNYGVCVQTTTKDKSIINTSINNKSIEDTTILDREERACTRDTHRSKAQAIVDLFNELCPSLSKVTVLSTCREKAITARLKEFTVEQFTTVFKKAEASKFLTGRNGKAWRANFDWLINASNFVKVLDGNYDDRTANCDGMSDNPEDDLPF